MREVYVKFLLAHLTSATLAPPSRPETLDVAAYVVLAHGALESFVEGLSLWALEEIEVGWTTGLGPTRGTASLLLHSPVPTPPADTSQAAFDTVRQALREAKTIVSLRIHENNGISIRHLRALFVPLGITVPTAPVLVASLDLLVQMRHEWAHQSRVGARVIRSAEEVSKIVADCLVLARQLARGALSVKPQ